MTLDDRLSAAQLKLRDGYNDDLSRAVAEARDLLRGADSASPEPKHLTSCRAYSNYQPPYEDCSCGADKGAASGWASAEVGQGAMEYTFVESAPNGGRTTMVLTDAQARDIKALLAASGSAGAHPPAWLYEREFYELMQAYRHTHALAPPGDVVTAFEAVKSFIVGKLAAGLPASAATCPHCGTAHHPKAIWTCCGRIDNAVSAPAEPSK